MSATVSQELLTQAPRFFGDGLDEIAAALLQNSRRAGASQVTVSTNPDTGTVTVTDDGRGLGEEAAGLLICFGGSLWDDATAEDERPAGIGFHALAARGVSVRSRDWRMSVTPAVFVGDEVATVTSAPTMGRGFSVSFPEPAVRGVGGRDAVRRAFSEAAATMRFTTAIDGAEVRRTEPVGLVMTPDGRPIADDVASRMVGHCCVVVGRFEDGERVPGWCVGYPEVRVTIDRFGHVLRLDREAMRARHRLLAAPIEEPLVVRVGGREPRWAARKPAYVVVVEALGSDTVVSMLPDQRGLSVEARLTDVGEAVVDLMATLAARAPRNGVAEGAGLRKAAAMSGIRVPPAQVVARRPRPRSANTRSGFVGLSQEGEVWDELPVLVLEGGEVVHRAPGLPPDDRLLRIPPPGPMLSMLLAAAHDATAANLRDRLVEAVAPLPGVADVEGVRLVIDGRSVRLASGGRLDDGFIEGWALASDREPGPTRAGGVLLILEGRGGLATALLPFAILGVAGSRKHPDVVLTPSATISDVVEALANATPWYDSGRSEGWVTQLEAFRARTRAVIGACVGGVDRRAVEAASRLAHALLANGRTADLESVGIAFDRFGATATVVARDGRRTEVRNRPGRGMER